MSSVNLTMYTLHIVCCTPYNIITINFVDFHCSKCVLCTHLVLKIEKKSSHPIRASEGAGW